MRVTDIPLNTYKYERSARKAIDHAWRSGNLPKKVKLISRERVSLIERRRITSLLKSKIKCDGRHGQLDNEA